MTFMTVARGDSTLLAEREACIDGGSTRVASRGDQNTEDGNPRE